MEPTASHRSPGGSLVNRPSVVRALAAALLTLAVIGCGDRGPDTSGRPHVVLITLDTVRADHVSAYEGSRADTPALADLGRQGAVFERAIASSGLTPTSHATILTGRFQYDHGLRVLAAPSGYRVDDDVPTLASVFREAGYRTAAIHSAFPVSRTFGFDRGFDHFDSFDAELTKVPGPEPGEVRVGWDVRRFQRRSDETTERAIAYLNEALAKDDRPLFLWLHYWDPHDPELLPPRREFEELYYRQVDGDLRDRASRTYATEVRWQDRNLGRLFLEFERLGLMASTLIAVTSDHGQGLADGERYHGWRAHRMLYREQVDVPLLLRGPGVPPGTRVQTQVRTADVAPTLLELAGFDPEESLGGRIAGESLVALLSGEGSAPDRVAYGEQVSGYDDNAGMRRERPDAAFMYMVSDGEWKLIYRPHMPERSELFHVSVDPKERRNVRTEHPDEYLRLMQDLAERNPWVLEPFPERGASRHGGGEALTGLGYTAAAQGTGDWWWTCPEHTEVREAQRGEHAGCGRILVPTGVWREPE